MGDDNKDGILKYILPGVQLLGGAVQSIFSGRKKNQRALEELSNQTPTYNGGQGIQNYYNQALSRYSANPYNSALYNSTMQNAQRTTNQGLSALQDRRSALAGIGKLAAIQDDAQLRAGIAAENEQAKRFGVLGHAAGMAGAEDKYRYTTNALNPYLRKLQVAQQKAAGSAAIFNAGLSNMFNAAQSGAMLAADSDKTNKILKAGKTINGATSQGNAATPMQEAQITEISKPLEPLPNTYKNNPYFTPLNY